MDRKTLALVSYITFVGWLISFFSYKGQEKDSLVSYHLKQSFGLFVAYIAYGILVWITTTILWHTHLWGLYWAIYYILSLGYIFFVVLMIIGIVNGSKGEEKPLPIIGNFLEKQQFNFIP